MSVTFEQPSLQLEQTTHQEVYVPSGEPDVASLISEAIIITNASNTDPLRLAAQAESRKEMNTELETVIDTVLGIKLLAIEAGDEQLLADADQIFLRALAGEPDSIDISKNGLEQMTKHDVNVHQGRVDANKRLLAETGFTEDDIAEHFGGPEQLSYEQLSIVHATDHEPVKSKTDGLLHIEDRFSADGKPRSTVHVALNHVVESDSTSADWSGKRMIVVAPMDRVVEMNGEPTSLVGHDTWWEAISNEGMALPTEAIVVKPGASKAIQMLHSKNEIRYKNASITEQDVDQLFEVTTGYEVKVLAKALGVSIESDEELGSYVSLLAEGPKISAELSGTTLQQYETNVPPEKIEKVKKSLNTLLAKDASRGLLRFVDTAKRVAVRMALQAQGREVIEPNTQMNAGVNFMSEPINDELNKLAIEKGTVGHHSESELGRLEYKLLEATQKPEGLTAEDRVALTQYVREHVAEYSKGTLHMIYRLGLI